jgi:hypothetical protein
MDDEIMKYRVDKLIYKLNYPHTKCKHIHTYMKFIYNENITNNNPIIAGGHGGVTIQTLWDRKLCLSL